jgi:hypothetical protein
MVLALLCACGRIDFARLGPGSGAGDDGGGDDGGIPVVRPTPCVLGSDMSLGLLAFSTDPAGNAYVLLDLAGSITLGSQMFTNTPGDNESDYVAVSLDTSCNVRWAHRFVNASGSAFFVVGRKTILPDGNGGAFVGGDFIGSIDPGNGVHNAQGGNLDEDVFVARLSADGALAWFHQLGTASGELGGGLALAPDGGVFVGGNFAGSINLGAGNVTSAGMDDIFLVAYDPQGTLKPGQRFGGAANEYLSRIATDAAGNVYAAGSFNAGAANFGTGSLANAGSYDGYSASFSSALAPLSSAGYGGTGFESTFAVTAGAGGAFFVAGEFDGPIDFGNGTIVPAGMRDVFVVGPGAWSRTFGGTANEGCESLIVDAAGEVVAAGGFSSTVDFGTGPVTPTGPQAYVVGFANDGSTAWLTTFGSGASISEVFAAPLSPGGVAVAAEFIGTLDIDGMQFPSAGMVSIAIAQVH